MADAGLVLVTGSSGRIGQAVVAELQRQAVPVRGFDRVATRGLSDMVVGDLQNALAIERAMTGVRTLVHLAATPDDDDFLRELVPNNVIGVYHVLEAARQAGVRRMILASSGQVVWHQRDTGPWPIRTDAEPTPRAWYAACKLFLEGAGRAFAEAYGMNVVAVRLGWCPRTREQVEEIKQSEWAQDVYLSPPDAGRFFAAAAQAPLAARFAVVYATSKPRKLLRYDLEPAKKLGFEPRDTWPEGLAAAGLALN
jgi:uronate dehydrogenase